MCRRTASCVFNAEILDFQAADGRGHPAVLIAMIVDAAVLADFPADGHALEKLVFENEIAGVIAFGKKKIFVDCFGADGVADDVVLDVFEREVALGIVARPWTQSAMASCSAASCFGMVGKL